MVGYDAARSDSQTWTFQAVIVNFLCSPLAMRPEKDQLNKEPRRKANASSSPSLMRPKTCRRAVLHWREHVTTAILNVQQGLLSWHGTKCMPADDGSCFGNLKQVKPIRKGFWKIASPLIYCSDNPAAAQRLIKIMKKGTCLGLESIHFTGRVAKQV